MGLSARNKFAFPVGFSPGINLAHPAAKNPIIALIAASAQPAYIDLLAGTFQSNTTLAPTNAIDAVIGPALSYPQSANTTQINITLPATSFPNGMTVAGICRTKFNSNGVLCVTLNNGWLDQTGGNQWQCGVDNANFPQMSVPSMVDVPWFVAASGSGSANNQNMLAINLSNGLVYTTTGPCSAIPSLASFAGNVTIGNGTINGAVNSSFSGLIAAYIMSGTYLTMQQLLQWAMDPWALWYPDADAIYVGAAGPATAALTARAATMSRGRIGFSGNAAVTAKGNLQLFARPNISGAVPIIGRSVAATRAKGNVAGAVPLIGRATADAMAKAQAAGKAAMSATGAAQSKASAAPAGIVPLLARATAQTKSLAGLSFGSLVALVARAAAMAKASLSSATGKAAMSATGAAQAKSTASPAGKAALAAHVGTAVKTLAGMGTGGFAALSARTGLAGKATGAPTGKAPLAATVAAQTKGAGAPAGNVPLAGRSAAQTKGVAASSAAVPLAGQTAGILKASLSSATGKAALSALGATQTKGAGAPAGNVPLAGKSAAMLKAAAAIGSGGFVALTARASLMAMGSAGPPTLVVSPPAPAPQQTGYGGRYRTPAEELRYRRRVERALAEEARQERQREARTIGVHEIVARRGAPKPAPKSEPEVEPVKKDPVAVKPIAEKLKPLRERVARHDEEAEDYAVAMLLLD